MKYTQMLKKYAVQHTIIPFYLIKHLGGVFRRIVYLKYHRP
jgi:hypothetical protein